MTKWIDEKYKGTRYGLKGKKLIEKNSKFEKKKKFMNLKTVESRWQCTTLMLQSETLLDPA